MLEVSTDSPSLSGHGVAFSAVLLAGGRSSRMGRDKAGVLWEGRPLWERQLETLRRLRPRELLISGKPDGLYADSGESVVSDLTSGCGPLSGMEAAFSHAAHPLVVVLAIDLPSMTTEFLASLIRRAGNGGKGVVPRIGGWFEPLAAIYPRGCLPLVRERLGSEDFSMQKFVMEAVGRGLLSALDVAAADVALFRNVNTPENLEDR